MSQTKLSITETTKGQNNSIYKAIEQNKGGAWLVVHRITGKLDLKRLDNALQTLGQSTHIFNKTYFRKEDRWLEISSDDNKVPITEIDFSKTSEASTYELINNLRRHQYSPQHGKQARFILIREKDSDLLVFTAATWLIDRFCIGTIFKTISDAYNNNNPAHNIDLQQSKLLKKEKFRTPQA